MKYISTRGNSPSVLFSQALQQGLAPDGGLYVPEIYPEFTTPVGSTELLLEQWFEGDTLKTKLNQICKIAFNFPAPLTFLKKNRAVLELYHGPTAAFKDFGAQFLSACISEIPELHPGTVLVATSGDTGGAVAAAFFKKPGIQVVILYPKGKISPFQEIQLTTWGENVKAIAVKGTFDDCQKLVKEALTPELADKNRTKTHLPKLLSANSINLGRLLPQTTYYATSSLQFLEAAGKPAGYIIPSGNLGNAVAALWAKRMGFPIREVILATNANLTLSTYFQSGLWTPQPSIKTFANAMDVGNPSNIERLNHLYPDPQIMRRDVRVISVNDTQIAKTIFEEWSQNKRLYCPHTATALFAANQLKGDWIVVSTADPSKFNEIIEPLIGSPAPLPTHLKSLLNKEQHKYKMGADLNELLDFIKS